MRLFVKLRGALAAAGIDHKYLAEQIGKSPSYISDRMTGKVQWTLDNQYTILDLINQPAERLHEFFPRGGMIDLSSEMGYSGADHGSRKTRSGRVRESDTVDKYRIAGYTAADAMAAAMKAQVDVACQLIAEAKSTTGERSMR